MYKVYAKADSAGRIIDVNSDAFLSSFDGWIKIDSGYGDKYHHAQSNYFEKPLTDERGIYRYITMKTGDALGRTPVHTYTYENLLYGIYERTQEEMDADWIEPEPVPSQEERIFNMERAVNSLLGGVLDTQA